MFVREKTCDWDTNARLDHAYHYQMSHVQEKKENLQERKNVNRKLRKLNIRKGSEKFCD